MNRDSVEELKRKREASSVSDTSMNEAKKNEKSDKQKKKKAKQKQNDNKCGRNESETEDDIDVALEMKRLNKKLEKLAKFSQRDQKQNETAEEYAAELKRLYDQAHKRRDGATRKEDLVRRFLDGLRDVVVRWEVEYVKEPRDIDEAVYHVVNYIQTRKRHQVGSNRRQRPVRRTGGTETDEADSENESDSDTVEYAFRVPKKRQFKRSEKTETKRKKYQTVRKTSVNQGQTKTEVKEDVIQALTQKIEELSMKVETVNNKSTKDDNRRSFVRCYNCNRENHFARECPNEHQQLCLFRCFQLEHLQRHVTNFPRHRMLLREKGVEDSESYLVRNPNPYTVGPRDVAPVAEDTLSRAVEITFLDGLDFLDNLLEAQPCMPGPYTPETSAARLETPRPKESTPSLAYQAAPSPAILDSLPTI
ncbi:uncharacterized protein LOC127849933 [Dreissena polymorpha]|uniref:uncharacterized protein LOC127849933 n=1 Tax=Dreissena polymorpha TaxID=45954 RepID=UPI002264CF83|nr:uncharacterized protein LOC127849933 [Dreissena polymorpha]